VQRDDALTKKQYRIESARLADWDYSAPGRYFATIGVRNHACLLGKISDVTVQLTAAGNIVASELLNIPIHYPDVLIDKFGVMPNHIHAIVMIGVPHRFSPDLRGLPACQISVLSPKSPSLSSIVATSKTGVTRRCREQGLEFGWQPRFHDHIIRNEPRLHTGSL
jgi:putative transposase